MPVKTAIVGYGRNGSTMHAGALERNPNFKVAAVCDIDPNRLTQAADRFGCPVYSSLSEMLAKEELDLVTIVTRSDQHAAMTCECLEAGANVLVTKPWAVNAAEARQMIATADKCGKKLFPWLPSRWSPWLSTLKQLLARKTIGDVFLIRRINTAFGIRNDWQTEKRYGGGYLLNWGPHLVDPPLVLAGEKVQSVYSIMRQVINPGDAEDMFMAVLTLTNGCIVQVEHTVSVESLPDWVIQGTRGTIVVRRYEVTVHISEPQKPDDPTKYTGMTAADKQLVSKEKITGSLYGSEDEVYAALARTFLEGTPFPVTTADGLYLSEVLDAIRESHEAGKVVCMQP